MDRTRTDGCALLAGRNALCVAALLVCGMFVAPAAEGASRSGHVPGPTPTASASSTKAELAEDSRVRARAASSYSRQVAVGRKIIRIGRWRVPRDAVRHQERASMASAERAIGPGREVFAYRSAMGGRLVDDPFSCVLQYPSAGLSIGFGTLGVGAEGRFGCDDPSGVFINSAHVTGRQWETSRGLGIGDSVRTLRRLYPGARSNRVSADTPPGGRSWWLKRKRLDCCDRSLVPALEAVVVDGKVDRLIVSVGAQGE